MATASSFRELLERYGRGERDFAGCDLDVDPDNDLSGVCLDGIDLSRSCVVATFRGASFRGAKFRNANVKTCDFSEADVSNADFSGALLCSTTWIGARMNGAVFTESSYHSYELKAGEQPDW